MENGRLILYIDEQKNKIEGILKKDDPSNPFQSYCKKIVLPDDFDITVSDTNDDGEPRKRDMTAEELYAAMSYKENRYGEYPDLADFADAYYWAQQGDNTKMNEYLAKIQAIKDKYPKVTNAS